MKKLKENLLENDFGAFLCDLRQKKQYTIEELAQKINIQSVTIKTIKKWEYDLEFPDLDIMYKLSEIYGIEVEVLMQIRTQTLQQGVKGINKTILRFIGYVMGISIYVTVILSYAFLFIGGIGAVLLFAYKVNKMAGL